MTYDDDPTWDALFAKSQPMLMAMADEALADAKAGRTQPMEAFLEEKDRTLDMQCAVLLGWEYCPPNVRGIGWVNPEKTKIQGEVPRFSEDAAAARLLEDEIEKRGKGFAYINTLSQIVPGADWIPFENWGITQVWAILRAPLAHRARAFVEVMRT